MRHAIRHASDISKTGVFLAFLSSTIVNYHLQVSIFEVSPHVPESRFCVNCKLSFKSRQTYLVCDHRISLPELLPGSKVAPIRRTGPEVHQVQYTLKTLNGKVLFNPEITKLNLIGLWVNSLVI